MEAHRVNLHINEETSSGHCKAENLVYVNEVVIRFMLNQTSVMKLGLMSAKQHYMRIFLELSQILNKIN